MSEQTRDLNGILAELKNVYRRFGEEMNKLLAPSGTVKDELLTIFFSDRTIHDSGLNEKFLQETRALLGEAAARLAEGDGAESPEALLRFVLLEAVASYPDDRARADRGVYWMLIAVQGECEPLLRYLPAEALEALYREYCAAFPRIRQMPNQKALKRSMQELLKQRY